MVKGKREQNKSLALKDKKESSDDDSLTSNSEDEEYAIAMKKKRLKMKNVFWEASNEVLSETKFFSDDQTSLDEKDLDNEIAFPTGDVRYREAFPTVPGLDVGQDMENIAKTSAMPHEALPKATSLSGGEGSMQQKLQELMDMCTSLGMDQGEDLLVGDTVKDSANSADKGSDSTDEMANVLGTLGATNILDNGGLRLVFTTASLSVATASTGVSPTVATASGSFLTAAILPPPAEQAERDSEIARIHAKRELEIMIAELDRSNETAAKYSSEYEQAKAGLSHDEKVELINELLMYQRNLDQIKNNAGWKAKDFKGITFEQIEEKFIPVWKKMQDFVLMNSKLESERLKRPGIQLYKERFKKLKTTKASGTEPTQEQQSEEPKELYEEELKKMMNLVPVKEL
uniref:Uncharacterized protein n=1 Tax=Tanacetum cinerariifolium TaxID=118510 RepID=A0A699H5Q9_TANCI|nr:hypothetical protein [Tanacetum cinerariifolium]